MTKPRFWRNDQIDDVASKRIRDYEAKNGVVVKLPVPIEEIVEQVLGLHFDWDMIDEHPGEQILGGLDAVNRRILLNEKHLDLFDQKPGLLRSTIGHEAGHWDVDIDRAALNHPLLPGMEKRSHVVHRHASKQDRLIEVLFIRAMHDERARELYKAITEGQDSPEVRSTVDRYQSSLLMPKWLMMEAADRYDVTSWPELYKFAEDAQVSISNLTVRLQRLGMIYLREGDKRIYRSRDVFTGQRTFF